MNELHEDMRVSKLLIGKLFQVFDTIGDIAAMVETAGGSQRTKVNELCDGIYSFTQATMDDLLGQADLPAEFTNAVRTYRESMMVSADDGDIPVDEPYVDDDAEIAGGIINES